MVAPAMTVKVLVESRVPLSRSPLDGRSDVGMATCTGGLCVCETWFERREALLMIRVA